MPEPSDLFWRYRLVVRTPGFHPGNRGPIPLSATNVKSALRRILNFEPGIGQAAVRQAASAPSSADECG